MPLRRGLLLATPLLLIIAFGACGDDPIDRNGRIVSVGADATTESPEAANETTRPSTKTSSTTIPVRTSATPTLDDITAIHAAEAGQRINHDNDFAKQGRLAIETVFVLDRLAHYEQGDLMLTSDSTLVSAEQRAAIERVLAPLDVRWVPNYAAAFPETSSPSFPPRDLLLTLGALTFGGELAEIASQIQCGFNCLDGGTRHYTRDPNGNWVVVSGTTETYWTS